jgi:hypothetical protein
VQAGNDSITPDQLRALALSVSELIPQGQFAAPSVRGNNAPINSEGKLDTKNGSQSDSAIKDSTAPKQHSQSVADQTPGKPAVQDSSATIQDQNPPSAPAAATAHSAATMNHDQAPTQTAPAQIAPAVTHSAGPAAKAAEQSVQLPAPAPQQLPAINSARLIQSMGQTELRVGMRTTEFGNISISTSSTRDLISAQISVDHSDLAKTIAAGLPEMQAKLGGSQGTDVRIEMNGMGAGLANGSSNDLSSGSREQSRGAREQAGSPAQDNSGPSVSERQFAPAAKVTTATEGRPDARLDITV